MIFKILGIIKDGGVKVNIIPEKAILPVAIRAPTDTEKDQLKTKVIECFKAAAMATGCTVRTLEYCFYDHSFTYILYV